jgi:hypothetical protein
MIPVSRAFNYAWETLFGREWKLEAHLQHHAIFSGYNQAADTYFTNIYRVDDYKNVLYGYRVRFVSIDKQQATRWHYIAIRKVIEIETGQMADEEMSWEAEH